MFQKRQSPGSNQHYNIPVHLRCALAIVVLSAVTSAQTPPSCPADRPVDDIISEVHSQQSKSKKRNTNPFPNVACIWNWCRDLSRSPTPDPEPQQAPPAEPPASANSSGASSSRDPKEDCDRAMEGALEAAHNIEVGDYYFEQKNYRAALLRYQDALAEKPGDAAIHVRLGRVLEKMKDPIKALEHYQAAGKLPAPEPWSEEASTAIARLQGRK